MTSQRICLIGGSGFIGRHLANNPCARRCQPGKRKATAHKPANSPCSAAQGNKCKAGAMKIQAPTQASN
ncbi:hypothetical protein [Chromobacterium piscinae]|uniref:hypothetical protein n=1 Tax=Chromobacterium piscinae TaxID=686831 RepID=UPI0032607BC7